MANHKAGGFGGGTPPSTPPIDELERSIVRLQDRMCGEAGAEASRRMRLTNPRNAVLRMDEAGSKGSFINLQQMMCCIGSTVVRGHRVCDISTSYEVPPVPAPTVRIGPDAVADTVTPLTRKLLTWRPRTLPHYTQEYPRAEEGGLVPQCYREGLTPQGFWAQAVATRPNLVDTAVNTQTSGYVQRRMSKALEDLTVRYDGTVRNCNGRIVRWRYGADPSMCIRKRCSAVALDSGAAAGPPALEAERRRVQSASAALRRQCELTGSDGEIVTPNDVPLLVRQCARSIRAASGGEDVREEAARRLNDFCARMANSSIRCVELVQWLELCIELRTDALFSGSGGGGTAALDAVDALLHAVEYVTATHAAQPGEAVGVRAAQALGEGVMQSVLNSFHVAGSSASNKALATSSVPAGHRPS